MRRCKTWGCGCGPQDEPVGPLLREDFPPLPAGCEGWTLRHSGTTVYVAARPDPDWTELLAFLNELAGAWRINADVVAS